MSSIRVGKEEELGTELEETEKGNALTFGDEKGMFHVAASCCQAVDVGVLAVLGWSLRASPHPLWACGR